MNPLQRKANSVEMTTTNHRGASGGRSRSLRRPRLLTYAAIVAVIAAVPVAAGAAAGKPSLAKPSGLQNFELKLSDAHDRRSRKYVGRSRGRRRSRGSPFAARHATSSSSRRASTSAPTTASSGRARTLTTPAAAVPISLPWITGEENSLYWRVRALGGGAVSQWSATQDFSMRWAQANPLKRAEGIPQKLPSEPGYVRWSPIEGATGYDVWFTNVGANGVGKIVSTIDDRRRRTRVSHAACAVRHSRVARPRQASALRKDAERSAQGLVRAVERGVRDDRGSVGPQDARRHADQDRQR